MSFRKECIALASMFLLAGCMTHADVQRTVGVSAVALGASTIAANSGLRLPNPMHRIIGVTSGATQVASGLALLNSSGSSQARTGAQPANATAPNGANGANGSGNTDLPKTRECTNYLRLATEPASLHMHDADDHLRRIFIAYHRCLDSQPDHPTSRRFRCGKGKYYVYPRGIQACGVEEAMRIWHS